MPDKTINSPAAQIDQIWFTRCPVPTASGVAHALGWLTEEFGRDGIKVDAFQDAATDLSKHHFDHKLDGLFREGGNIPALAAKATGAPSKLVGLTWIDEWQAIVVRKEHEHLEARDLKGLRIALPAYAPTRGGSIVRGMSLHGIKGALAIAGLSFDDVTFVDVPVQAIESASAAGLQRMWSGLEWLADGRVDAVYVKGASAADAAKRLGLVVGIDLDAYPSRMTRINNGTPRPITVHENLIENHFDLVVRFLDQTLRAADWAATNLPALRRILETETRAGAAGVATAYRNDFHRSLHPDLSAERIDLLRIQANFLWLHGFLEHAVDIDAWIDRRPLDAALALRAARLAA